MRLGPTYGIADGEVPQLVHRLSGIAGRAYCGKPISIFPRDRERSKVLVCRRCEAIDAARRDGLPEFGDLVRTRSAF